MPNRYRSAMLIATLFTIAAVGVAALLIFPPWPVAAQAETRVVNVSSFGPVFVGSGQALEVCSNNLFGENTLGFRVVFYSAVSALRPLAVHDGELRPGEGRCFSQGGPMTLAAAVLPPAKAGPAPWQPQQAKFFVSTAQVRNTANGLALLVLPAVQHNNVALPPLDDSIR